MDKFKTQGELRKTQFSYILGLSSHQNIIVSSPIRNVSEKINFEPMLNLSGRIRKLPENSFESNTYRLRVNTRPSFLNSSQKIRVVDKSNSKEQKKSQDVKEYVKTAKEIQDLYRNLQVARKQARNKSNSNTRDKINDSSVPVRQSLAEKKTNNFLLVPNGNFEYSWQRSSTRSLRSPEIPIPKNKKFSKSSGYIQEKSDFSTDTSNLDWVARKEEDRAKYLYASKNKKTLRGLSLLDFQLGKTLGEGRFGVVYFAIHRQTRSIFALKKVKKAVIKSNMLEEQFMMEIKMQFFFQNPHILRLYGIFDDAEHIYLILEYMEEGTLYFQLKKNNKLTEEETKDKIGDTLKAIEYLHSKSVTHRDIKPQNIVISHGVSKLCDFGWSAICKDNRRTTFCGTLDYSAPQILEGKDYDKSVDLWCLGVLTYELLVGKAPFYHISRKETMKKIMNAEEENIQIPANLCVSSDARDFISRLIVKDSELRMTAAEAMKHNFLSSYMNNEVY